MNEPEAFSKLKESILREKGLDVNQYKENYLKRRLAVRMRSLQAKTYLDYLRVLENNKKEYDLLLDKLTINVTQFFRDSEIFTELENNILPDILRNAGPAGAKVWSAGCSTGEEPYSIAMSITDTAERLGAKNPVFEIYATDLDEAAIYRAIEGKYEGRTLENVGEARKRKYFNFDGKNYLISDRIKQKVKYVKLNLMNPYKTDFFDLVFCRNVIIYFSRELQKKVMMFFYDSLKPRGILFLGKTETMLPDLRDKLECINIKERIFRKV